ncbi:ketopantoate reductase family protein [Acuticoccus sp. I52.16.1]|uniref:ketopantoate reductase family protein n=1 Tax=Acuticoccus sp. I52.16.1 TaxID=2928472 RepID=UPI001FD2DB85|nr:2-dehydropantoate 2-reductase N-terminal domain-containing protein [Acuticoccus sp. I52.16.1]UOM35762.1 ketopantoate reductase family protein [Acuticoccus sp. I52.16.1]
MRTIVYGVGAIGGVVAAALTLAGREVVGIARGNRLALINEKGLLLRTPEASERVPFPCVGDPSEIDFRADDAILLTMKTQDTLGALDRLRAAGVTTQPIFCMQNGVTNERFALRRFPEVHGVTVRMPGFINEPDDACVFSGPKLGIFDLGRYPGGQNAHDHALAEALEAGNIAAFVHDDVMRLKYGKLFVNLQNIIEAALGRGADFDRLYQLAKREAEEVLTAAAVGWDVVDMSDEKRKKYMKFLPIEGVKYDGGSTTQSLMRGSGSVETDYMNGEVTLLARLNGMEAPVNAYLVELSGRLVRDGLKPGALTIADLEADLAQRDVTLDS